MMKTDKVRGTVFNLQHYSIHDGPGIRTTVFLKGCPLRCLWCQNPESQNRQPVVFLFAEKCVGCGTCRAACPENAIQLIDGKSRTDRDRCTGHGECAAVCPQEARNLMGREISAQEVFEDVYKDEIFYRNSGGGVTLSGGDPVAQPEFATSILKRCRDAGIHTAIETCGFAEWKRLKSILEYTDLVLYDIKHMDSAKHGEYTGVPNELILENAVKIHKEIKLPMLARVPIIPGYNDSAENLTRTAGFIVKALGGSGTVHLLPYHPLGETKYERMEEAKNGISVVPPDAEHLEAHRQIFQAAGLTAVIGG